jgi:hypothetical protein
LAVIRREAATISEFIDEAEEALFVVDARV